MQRILLIGNAGAGKTTFAKQLAQKLHLPLVHLDNLFWCSDWDRLSRDKFDSILQSEVEKPQWIIDGNSNRTIPRRLQYCDPIFYFDFPTIACLTGGHQIPAHLYPFALVQLLNDPGVQKTFRVADRVIQIGVGYFSVAF